MKPFDLEAAMNGAPIKTRAGDAVRFIAYVPDANESCQIVTLTDFGTIHVRRSNGQIFANNTSSADLVMAPQKVTRYVNLMEGAYSGEPWRGFADHYDSEAGARDGADRLQRLHNKKFIGIAVPVEIEI